MIIEDVNGFLPRLEGDNQLCPINIVTRISMVIKATRANTVRASMMTRGSQVNKAARDNMGTPMTHASEAIRDSSIAIKTNMGTLMIPVSKAILTTLTSMATKVSTGTP